MNKPVFQANRCPLSGIKQPELKVYVSGINKHKGDKGYQWYYPYRDNFLIVVEYELYHDQSFWDENRLAIFYLIENGIWPEGKMVDRLLLKALISSSRFPKSPIDKIQEVLYFISKEQKHLGEWLDLKRKDFDSICRKTGVIHPDEFEWIIRESDRYGYLDIKADHSDGMVIIVNIEGLNIVENRKHARESNTVFVAMAFNDEMFEIYNNYILTAIEKSGFKPYIVTDQHPESDVTINDAILAGIKKSLFTIADFTHHKSGVYFEAGYALGRGQKVIYTCHESHIGTAHFDTRNYQHLIWKDGTDLKKKLMNKIEVFIKA